MAWVADTSFETTDGSTTPTDGNTVTSTGDGSGWATNWAHNGTYADKHVYDNGASAPDGTWCVMCDTSANNWEPYIKRTPTTSVTSGHFEIRYKTDVDDRDRNYIYLEDAGNTNLVIYMDQVTSNTGRHLKELGGGTTIASNAFSEGTWYKVGIDFDCTTDTYDIYIDGVKKNGSAINFKNTATTIDSVKLSNSAASGFSGTPGNIHYWDVIADGDAAAPTTNNSARRLHMMMM